MHFLCLMYIQISSCSLAEVYRSSLCFTFTVACEFHPVEKLFVTNSKLSTVHIYRMNNSVVWHSWCVNTRLLFIWSPTCLLNPSVCLSLSTPPVCTSCNGNDFFKETEVKIWMFRNYKRCCNMKYIYNVHCAILFWRTMLSNKNIRVCLFSVDIPLSWYKLFSSALGQKVNEVLLSTQLSREDATNVPSEPQSRRVKRV